MDAAPASATGLDNVPAFPTLFEAAVENVVEVAVGDARAWTSTRSATALTNLVPDLSQDVVLIDGTVVVTQRTTRATEIVVPGGSISGLRLPIAATEVVVDRAWPGWIDVGTGGHREVLREALDHGAITWTTDLVLDRYIRLSNRPGPRIGAVARELAMSERTLRRLCWSWFGAGPSHVARVLRLWRFLHEVRSTSVARAASTAGFADQAHASRDAVALTRFRVRELARRTMAE